MKIYFNIEYRTRWGESVGVNVSQGTSAPLRAYLSTTDGVTWQGSTELPDNATDVVTYRYFIEREGRETRIEVGTMPHVLFPKRGQKEYEQNDWWRDPKKVAGVAVPVFSLRSDGSQGVGDFGDLKMLIDWVVKVGMGAVQILPINDTTITHEWTDSYPYNSISIYALHPMYMDLRQLGRLNDEVAMQEYEKKRLELNALLQIDYEAVNNFKRGYIRKMYEQEGASVLRKTAFKTFYKKNEEWLKPYAVFSFLRDTYGTAEFSTWTEHSVYDAADAENVLNANKKAVSYYFYVQYNLHIQLLTAGNHAREREVILKGDIPIGISRKSVEAWLEPYYFNMNGQAGAPPDVFADDGQNWGFPTYNWDVMAMDGYRWWMRRMRKMAEYFSAYRIDHILGFFRIWEIPMPHKSGLMGHFSPAMPMSVEEIESWGVPFVPDMYLADPHNPNLYHLRISAKKEDAYKELPSEARQAFDRMYENFFYRRHNQFWYEEAMKKLPALTRSTQMIVCGEDLGMVPECVPWVMNDLHILSLEIQSMPKSPWHEFGVLQEYPTLSVCTISSHDTPTMRGWWEEDPHRTQRYYNNAFGRQGEAPKVMTTELCETVIRQHLESPSVLCILTLQDWLSIDSGLRYPDVGFERINVPVNPKNYWRYRMHLTIDRLMQEDDFNARVKKLAAR